MITDWGMRNGDDEPDKIAEAILKLYKDPILCREMGMRGYEFGHLLYSRSENMKKIQKIV